jgi:hypothetical protein
MLIPDELQVQVFARRVVNLLVPMIDVGFEPSHGIIRTAEDPASRFDDEVPKYHISGR